MESGINARTAAVLELWKNIYRQLLQIQTADEKCNLLLCLEQLIDCADHINSCFENLWLFPPFLLNLNISSVLDLSQSSLLIIFFQNYSTILFFFALLVHSFDRLFDQIVEHVNTIWICKGGRISRRLFSLLSHFLVSTYTVARLFAVIFSIRLLSFLSERIRANYRLLNFSSQNQNYLHAMFLFVLFVCLFACVYAFSLVHKYYCCCWFESWEK